MDFSVSKEPLYLKVKKVILEAISVGEIGKNNQLPSEKILCQKFNVSRATIRSALQSLEDDRIIRKQQGVGTFLIQQNQKLKMRIDKVKGFYQLIGDTGHAPSIREEGILREPIDKKISEQLRVPSNTQTLILKRTLMGDSIPAIHIREYIPFTILTRLPSDGELPNSIFEISETFCLQRIEYSISEIIPTTVNSSVRDILDLPMREPVLKLEELHFNKNDLPIIFSEVYVNDNIIRFNVLRTRDRLQGL
jgi:GntR family transcriptional regulator